MRKLATNRKGQFIVIAVLMIAIMIISVTSIMYNAVTYFRYERWEEYLGIIDNTEINAYRLMELSLANYTMTDSLGVLKANLDQWQRDLMSTHSQFRIVVNYTLASGGTPIYYDQGLNKSWNKRVSLSAASAGFKVDVTSVGLTGYRFTSSVVLNLTILDVLWHSKSKRVDVRLSVTMEGQASVPNLQKSNFLQFQVNGNTITNFNVSRRYESTTYKCFIYELRYSASTAPTTPVSVLVSLIDSRSIRVTGFGNNLNLVSINE